MKCSPMWSKSILKLKILNNFLHQWLSGWNLSKFEFLRPLWIKFSSLIPGAVESIITDFQGFWTSLVSCRGAAWCWASQESRVATTQLVPWKRPYICINRQDSLHFHKKGEFFTLLTLSQQQQQSFDWEH